LFGILLIFIIIFLPNGIAGDYRKVLRLFRAKKVSVAR
jgi:ABC-type branched-subunit amino acid transport system permease subunit